MVREVEGFDAGEKSRFAGVVEAEEEDGVLCDREEKLLAYEGYWEMKGAEIEEREGI